MRVVVQKCSDASVTVQGTEVGKISQGLVLFVGFTSGDDFETIQWMVHKILHLRIFEDEDGIMNRSVLEQEGKILSVSQFTLYADTSKGNRPSYFGALSKDEALPLYQQFNQELSKYIPVETGEFGALMEVHLTNLGPTTILLER